MQDPTQTDSSFDQQGYYNQGGQNEDGGGYFDDERGYYEGDEGGYYDGKNVGDDNYYEYQRDGIGDREERKYGTRADYGG